MSVRTRYACLLVALLALIGHGSAHAQEKKVFRAGAHAQNINPKKYPVSVNGGMTDRQAKGAHDDLHARCLVLDDGTTQLALVVVDACMVPREVCDEAKRQAQALTGIPASNILISATHTHTAPTLAGVFQSEPNPEYVELLPRLIAQGIKKAFANREPARIGWGVGKDDTQVFNRRWYRKHDLIPRDPFGKTTDQVQMNPGYKAPGLIKPAGPIDPDVSIIAVQSTSGRPIAVLANYSLHYVGGVPELSADYFGVFAERIKQLVKAEDAKPPFVGIMSNGTSGDINNVNFAAAAPGKRAPYEQARIVADSVARAALKAYEKIAFQDWVPLAAATREIELGVRLPSAADVTEAQQILAKAKGPVLQKREEIYARETVLLAKYPPKVKVVLQALRVGDLGIAAIPCEVFCEIGLEIKKKSPFKHTFTIELANGYNGYLPTPAQHQLGGYETWRARSSYLEVGASPKITKTVLELLRQVAPHGKSAAADEPVRLPFTAKHLKDSIRTDWFGVYLHDKKIGYARTSFEEAKDGDTPIYRVRTLLKLQAKSAGVPFEMLIEDSSDFDADPPYALRRTRSWHKQGGPGQEIVLTRDAKGFLVTTVNNGKKSTKRIGPLDYTLADEMTTYVWLLGRPKPGDRIVGRSFDFDKLRIDTVIHKMLGAKTMLVKGVKVTYYEVEATHPSQKVTMMELFDQDGLLISGKIGGLFELRLEAEKDAKNLDKNFDLFVSGLVKIDRPVGDPKHVRSLVVEVKGREPGLVKSGPRQSVATGADGKLVVKIGRKHGVPTPATDKEREDCLQDTTSYPVKHPRVQELARKAVGDAKTDREKVERLVKFVHRYIKPDYRGKGLIVLDLIEEPRGDCTAYAALFTTLARAAGVPAREVSGFAYMGDAVKAFGGHAWCEVVLDGHWHPIDASVGAFEVDAARLSLGSDNDGGLNLLRNFGSLSLRLIEVEHDRPAKQEQPQTKKAA